MKIIISDMSIEVKDRVGDFYKELDDSRLKEFYSIALQIEKIRAGRINYTVEPTNPFRIIGSDPNQTPYHPVKLNPFPINQDTFINCDTTPQNKEEKS